MGGVIAAGHRLTAEAGAEVLRSGGTAFDAVIAALAMSCVCEPVLSSPGGGGFATVLDGATGRAEVIDFFPQTPLQRHDIDAQGVREVLADFGTATQAFHIGPATAATPGFFAGVTALAAAGATRPLAELFAPAIGAARRGVVVTDFQHHLSTVVAPILTATTSAREVFAPAGHLLAAGETFRNAGLADALEILATEGFVGSAVARACIDAQRGRGHLDHDDIARYEAVHRSPHTIRVGDALVHLNPLPAAGGVLVAHTLRHLESADPVDMARALHATGRARAASSGALASLADVPLRQRGTTHISVVDARGTACAVTVSNGEGNGEIVDGFGFMLNNVLGEEDVNPAGTHAWPVDVRLSSMMCPAIVEHDDGTLTALGSGGSNRIRSAIAQVVAHLCLGEPDLASAVEAPRLHVEGEHLDFEDRFEPVWRDRLTRLFEEHRVWPQPDLFFGGAHSVQRTSDGRLVGTGDRRRAGHAIVVE